MMRYSNIMPSQHHKKTEENNTSKSGDFAELVKEYLSLKRQLTLNRKPTSQGQTARKCLVDIFSDGAS